VPVLRTQTAAIRRNASQLRAGRLPLHPLIIILSPVPMARRVLVITGLPAMLEIPSVKVLCGAKR